MPARNFIIDGELVASSESYDFYTLPAAIRRKHVSVIAFDLLHLNGKDRRRFPLKERRASLGKLVGSSDVIQFSETFNDPVELLTAAEQFGLEGIVSKRADLGYRSGRCAHWHKIKTDAWRVANADRGERFNRKR